MTIKKKCLLDNSMPVDVRTFHVNEMKNELFVALADYVDSDGYYSIKYDIMQKPADYDCNELCMCIYVDRAQERIVNIKTQEQINLRPQKSFINRLKCCAKYLRDKTGGVFDD